MPYCQGKSKARIKYKYANDAEWTILDINQTPIDYSIIVNSPLDEGGQCNQIYRPNAYFIGGRSGVADTHPQFCGKFFYATGGNVVEGPIAKVSIPALNFGDYFVVDFTDKNNIVRRIGFVTGTGRPVFYTPNCTSSGASTTVWAIGIDRVVYTGGNNNCGSRPSTCTFKVFGSTNQVLLERTERECPQVENVTCGESCPPETICQCDKGNYVCCYDATGNAIYSYPK